MLFLKYLDDLEQERQMAAEQMGEEYRFIIDEEHRWSSWAISETSVCGVRCYTEITRQKAPFE